MLNVAALAAFRILFRAYRQIWRYGGIQCYIKLLAADGIAFILTVIFEAALPIEHVTFPATLSVSTLTLLGSLAMRMMYRYAYKCSNNSSVCSHIVR